MSVHVCRSGLWMVVLAGVALLQPGCATQRPVEAIRTSGEQKFKAGNYAAARDEYAEIVSRYPGDWDAQYKLGLSMIETGDLSGARRALETAYTLKPRNQDVANALAEVLFRQNDESRLFAFLRERAERTQLVEAYLQLGKYAMALNDPDSAQTALDTAIEIDNAQTTDPYLQSALLAERLGHLDVAITRLRQAMNINPHDPRVAGKLRELGEDPTRLAPLPPGRDLSNTGIRAATVEPG